MTKYDGNWVHRHSQPNTKHATQGLPESYAPLLVENVKREETTHIFAGHSAFGKSLMPRLAALLDKQQISDITGVESEDSRSIIRMI